MVSFVSWWFILTASPPSRPMGLFAAVGLAPRKKPAALRARRLSWFWRWSRCYWSLAPIWLMAASTRGSDLVPARRVTRTFSAI